MAPVTVGFDGSAESEAAADWAALEAERRNLPLRLLYVWSWQPHSLTADPDKEREWIERVPRDAARRLAERHPGLQITHEGVPGVAADILVAAAKQSAVLALGSRALGTMRGFLLGSVGHEVTSRAENPVVLIRAGHGEDQGPWPEERGQGAFGAVCVGLDLVQPGHEVLDFAFEAAAERGARLCAVHVWKPLPVFTYDPRIVDLETRTDMEQRAAGFLSGALRPWRERFPQVEVEERATPGNASQRLVELSDGASLLVIGRRIRRRVPGPRLGAVAHAALHHATPPVAVVPHT
jgi:nucleotide-binding universal stress UspA family protein